jgi:hypothetical protein
LEQAHLANLCFEGVGAGDVVNGAGLAEQRSYLPSVVTGEVRPHPLPQVRGLADVEHVAATVAEQVDPRRARERRGEGQFLRLGMAGDGRPEQVRSARTP